MASSVLELRVECCDSSGLLGARAHAALQSLIESAKVPGLLADRRHLAGVLRVFERRVAELCAWYSTSCSIGRSSSAGSQKEGAAKITPSAALVLIARAEILPLSFLNSCRISQRRSARAVKEGLGQLLERVAALRHVVEQPARDQHEVVVDDVAAGHFDRLDQAERRLLAERAVEDDAGVVALRPRQRSRPRRCIRAPVACAPRPAAPCRRAAPGTPRRSAPARAWLARYL